MCARAHVYLNPRYSYKQNPLKSKQHLNFFYVYYLNILEMFYQIVFKSGLDQKSFGDLNIVLK